MPNNTPPLPILTRADLPANHQFHPDNTAMRAAEAVHFPKRKLPTNQDYAANPMSHPVNIERPFNLVELLPPLALAFRKTEEDFRLRFKQVEWPTHAFAHPQLLCHKNLAIIDRIVPVENGDYVAKNCFTCRYGHRGGGKRPCHMAEGVFTRDDEGRAVFRAEGYEDVLLIPSETMANLLPGRDVDAALDQILHDLVSRHNSSRREQSVSSSDSPAPVSRSIAAGKRRSRRLIIDDPLSSEPEAPQQIRKRSRREQKSAALEDPDWSSVLEPGSLADYLSGSVLEKYQHGRNSSDVLSLNFRIDPLHSSAEDIPPLLDLETVTSGLVDFRCDNLGPAKTKAMVDSLIQIVASYHEKALRLDKANTSMMVTANAGMEVLVDYAGRTDARCDALLLENERLTAEHGAYQLEKGQADCGESSAASRIQGAIDGAAEEVRLREKAEGLLAEAIIKQGEMEVELAGERDKMRVMGEKMERLERESQAAAAGMMW